MYEFTFEIRGWWNAPGTVCVLSQEVLTTNVKKIIKESFLKSASNTKIKKFRSEGEYSSVIFPALGEVNEEIFNASGYVHMFKSMEDANRKCTLTMRKLEKTNQLNKTQAKNLFKTLPGGIEWAGGDIDMETMPKDGKIEWYCCSCRKNHITMFSDVYQLVEGHGAGAFVINCLKDKQMPDGNKQCYHDVYIDLRKIPKPVLPILKKVSKRYPLKKDD